MNCFFYCQFFVCQKNIMSTSSTTDEQWEELRREMKEFFDEFDINHTGKLGVEEITAILKSVGLRCTTEEVREMMSISDPSSTTINFDQLMEILKNHTHQENEDEMIVQAFRTIDIDGDQRISPEDLQCFMQSLGEDFDIKYAERMLRYAAGLDKNSTERVSIDLETYKKQLNSFWVNEAKKQTAKD